MNEKKYIYKVTILGDYAVGKTSILNGYMEQKFDYDYKPTLGANIVKKEIRFPDKVVSVNIWDIAGQLMFRSLHRAFFEASNGVIIVFDVSRPETFDHLPKWYSDFKKYVENFCPGVICANKIDLDRKIDINKGKELADKIGFHYVETSALKKINLKEAFEYLLSKIIPK
ncbi:MAG: Rab family GTPase [Candidatus Helarchaeota archaeon]